MLHPFFLRQGSATESCWLKKRRGQDLQTRKRPMLTRLSDKRSSHSGSRRKRVKFRTRTSSSADGFALMRFAMETSSQVNNNIPERKRQDSLLKLSGCDKQEGCV